MNTGLVIYADGEIPYVASAFAALGEVRLFDGRQTQPGQFKDGDVLLVRSVTRVDAALLKGSRIRFVASATAGTDHIDHECLANHGIAFANAPGGNAVAAAEYSLAGLLLLSAARGERLDALTVGVIGCGQVGGRLAALCEALGARVLRNDPPRAEREGSEPFVDLAAVAACDAVSIHTPLTCRGPHPTQALINADFLNALRPGSLLLNAGRGEVVDEAALLARLLARADLHVHLDVWDHEPEFSVPLLAQIQLGSPHIAGYTLEGKLRGTQMILDAACAAFSAQPQWHMQDELPEPELFQILAGDLYTTLRGEVLRRVDPRQDDAALRALCPLSANERAAGFDRLRRHYALRRELSAFRLAGADIAPATRSLFEAVGFSIAPI